MLLNDDVAMDVDELHDELTELIVIPRGSPASKMRRAILLSRSGRPIHASIPPPAVRALDALRAPAQRDRAADRATPAQPARPPAQAARPVLLVVLDDEEPDNELHSTAPEGRRRTSAVAPTIELSPFAAGAGRGRSSAQLRLERLWR